MLPGTRVQIWFGAVVCVAAFTVHVAHRPFEERTAQRVQGAALLQLLLTYLTAQVFYDRLPDDATSETALGVGLVAANLICLLFIGLCATSGLLAMAQEAKELVLTFDDGRPVRLQPPAAPGGFHIFLSHGRMFTRPPFQCHGSPFLPSLLRGPLSCLVCEDLGPRGLRGRWWRETCSLAAPIVFFMRRHSWTHGQDAMATIKSMLRLLMPRAQVRAGWGRALSLTVHAFRRAFHFAPCPAPSAPIAPLPASLAICPSCLPPCIPRASRLAFSLLPAHCTLPPPSQCFLDVDNLSSIADLEMHVEESDLVLIFLTRGYISSRTADARS